MFTLYNLDIYYISNEKLSFNKNQKLLCRGLIGGLQLPIKLPFLLKQDKFDKEPFETFFDMADFGEVYALKLFKPPP